MERFNSNIICFLKKNMSAILLFVFFIILIGCASSEREIVMDRTTFSFDQDKSSYSYDVFSDYHIAPGDILDILFQIHTWVKKSEFRLEIDDTVDVKFVLSPELNETQKIRPDGTITLPYLGKISAAGKTVDELTEELKAQYSKVLKDPELYVVVPEFRSSIKELKADLHTAPRGLSRLVTVRPDGYVTFPMVGDIFVAGRTIPVVNKELNAKYEEMIPDLHIDLFLEKYSGSLIYVLGQVTNPGAFQIMKPVTIFEALTLAGSYLPGAKLSSVIVARKHETKIISTRINLKDTLAMKSDSKFFYLQPDDLVFVPKTFITEAGELMRQLAQIVLFNGWSASAGIGFSYELHNEPTTSKTKRQIVP